MTQTKWPYARTFYRQVNALRAIAVTSRMSHPLIDLLSVFTFSGDAAQIPNAVTPTYVLHLGLLCAVPLLYLGIASVEQSVLIGTYMNVPTMPIQEPVTRRNVLCRMLIARDS